MRDEPTDNDPLAPFRWHPEPELIGVRDAATSRAALERAGEATWTASLDWLYDQAMVRAMGLPTGYAELRRAYFGETDEPGPAPDEPATLQSVLDEFATRIAPHTLNSFHPRALSYFTPPPLVASIVGEVLTQWTNQGVDVWHAGPVAAFVEEEVGRWLCDLVGYGEGSFGLLTSGGVMANFIALALVRDVHLRALTGAARPPRGAALEGVRVYASDQAHFSIARALDELGFPPETLVLVPADDAFRLHAAPVAEAIARDRAAGLRPVAIAAVAGSTNTGSVDLVPELAALAHAEGLWLHVDAAYGGAARLSARDADRVPGLHLADSVTIDPHKWFFQAYDVGALLVRDGRHLRQAFDRSPEYYRGGEAAVGAGETARAGRPRRGRRRPCRPAELLQARLRGDPPVPGAQAVGDLEAPRHAAASAGSSSATTTSPRTWRPRAPRPTTSRRSPSGPSSASCASVTCRAGARPPTRWHPRTSTHTRTASRRRSSSPATAGCRRPRSAAGPGCAPGSSTT